MLPAVLTARAAAATAAAAAQAGEAVQMPGTASAAAYDGASMDIVPAVPMPARLQPAKQAVYTAFHDQVHLC